MKVKNAPGEHAFKALYKTIDGWKLSDEYFFDSKEVLLNPKYLQVIWPVEVIDGQIVYIPDQSELCDQ